MHYMIGYVQTDFHSMQIKQNILSYVLNTVGMIYHITLYILARIGNDCTEKSTKYPEMHLDENLSWKYHINEINKNIKVIIFSKAS